MFEFWIIACLMSRPAECKTERLPWDGTEISCNSQMMLTVAEWQNQHPKWRAKRWGCGRPETST